MTKTEHKPKAKVLVSYVYTDHKAYCRHLYPRSYFQLSYEPRECCYVDGRKIPALDSLPTSEQIAAVGRNYAIKQARAGDYTHILFLDFDVWPQRDTIQRLLAANTDIAGGLVAARGNVYHPIAHRYSDETTLERIKLHQRDCKGTITTGGVAAACMLVTRRVFEFVDLDDYYGPETIPGRFTADDEFFCIKALTKLGVRPKLVCNVRPWHYAEDGYKYKCFEEAKKWDANEKLS